MNLRRLNKQIHDLQKDWDTINEKVNRLRDSWIIETRSEEKFRLKGLITEAESQRQEIERQLHELENRLERYKKIRKYLLIAITGILLCVLILALYNVFFKPYPLIIYTEPQNVQVYINGELKGMEGTYQLRTGTYDIIIKKDDYQEVTRTIKVQRSRNVETFRLKKLQDPM